MEDVPKPFLDHLEELRFRLIKALISVAGGTVAGFLLVDPVIRYLAKPVGKFVYLVPTEAFFIRLKIALALGFFLALPFILFQIWQFVVVALKPKEKKTILWILPTSYLLFAAGASFALFYLVPAGAKFLLSYSSDILVSNISIESYVNFAGVFCLVLGATFQMPLVSFFLSKIGLLDSRWLSNKRRWAVLIFYISSAILTPGPDPVTAIMLFIPTYCLFECSILTARMARAR